MEVAETDRANLEIESFPMGGAGSQSSRLNAASPAKQPLVGPTGLGQESLWRYLSREVRRADRYNVPLSLVHFRLNREPQNGDAELARQFFEILSENKRETDLLANLDDQLVSVLLVSTDRSGAERFAERVGSKVESMRFSRTIRTYPHDPLELFFA